MKFIWSDFSVSFTSKFICFRFNKSKSKNRPNNVTMQHYFLPPNAKKSIISWLFSFPKYQKLSIYFLTENSIFPVQIFQAKIAKSLVVGIGIEHNFASIIEVNILHFQNPLNLALPRCFFLAGYFKRLIMCSIVHFW